MSTTVRILAGAGLFMLGYYLGREIGRLESVRKELSREQAQSGHTWDADDLGLRREKIRT